MNPEKNRKYLVFSVVAMAALMISAVSISNSHVLNVEQDLNGTDTQDETGNNIDTNDGKSISDGDGETNDDNK